MRAALRILLVVLALVAPATMAHAQTESPLGILQGNVLIGSDGDWDGDVAEGAYRLVNAQGKTSAVRYFHVEPPVPEGSAADGWTFSVDVTLRPAHERAFAGLLYDFVESPRHYLIFALTADGRAVLWRRTASGIEALAQSDPVQGRRNVVLRVIHTEARSLFLVGDDLLAELGSDQIVDGEVGIIGGGRGASVFKAVEWQTVTVQQGPAAEPPAAPAAEVPPALPAPTAETATTPPVAAEATPPSLPEPVAETPATPPAAPAEPPAAPQTDVTAVPLPETAQPEPVPPEPAVAEPVASAPAVPEMQTDAPLGAPAEPASASPPAASVPAAPAASLGALGGEQPVAPSLGALGGAPSP